MSAVTVELKSFAVPKVPALVAVKTPLPLRP